MSKKLKDRQPMGAGRLLAKQELLQGVVPLVVHGFLDLDETLELVKRGVAVGFERLGGSKALHGFHLSRSDRWVHRHLSAALGTDRRLAAAQGDPHLLSPNEEALGAGYRFMLRILEHVEGAGHPVTLAELRGLSGLDSWHLSDSDLLERLHLYSRMGLLAHRQEGGTETWAPSEVLLTATGAAGERPLPITEGSLFPTKLTSRSHPRAFTQLRVRLSRSALRTLRVKMTTHLQDCIADLLLQPVDVGEEAEEVEIVVALGVAGFSTRLQ